MEVLLGGINRKLDAIEEKINEISDWAQRRKKETDWYKNIQDPYN